MLLGTSIIPLVTARFPQRDSLARSQDVPQPAPRGEDPEASRTDSTAHPAQRPILLRNLEDTSALRDVPFVLLIGGLLTTFMGIYTILYYIDLFALQRTSAASSVSSSILVIVNGASTVGRILPSALADRIGPTHVLAATAFLSATLALVLCSTAVERAAGIIAWAIVFGSTAGAFMGLPAAGVVSLSNSREKIGARLGMTLSIVGSGILISEPIAGAILRRQDAGWPGLMAWSGALMLAGSLFVASARITRAGWILRKVV